MFDLTNMPISILNKVDGLPYNYDGIGESDAKVLIYDNMVLKIEKTSRSSRNEKSLLKWLNGKVSAPKIIEAETQNGYSYLLMTKLTGEMACADNLLQNNMNETVKALANGLKMLWEVDITDCPCSNTVSEKLVQAKYNIDNNLVDIDDFNPETFTTEGFIDVHDLYNYLNQNRPTEDLVFTHGDFCLPNIFVCGDKTTGILDWGSGGIADRWQDIALCVRSLHHNYIEYKSGSESDYTKYKAMLFDELGIAPDEEKIRYYILLDELF